MDINFRWFQVGQIATDHVTISHFRNLLLSDGAVDEMFFQLVLYPYDVRET
jgi:hypothetical protein